MQSKKQYARHIVKQIRALKAKKRSKQGGQGVARHRRERRRDTGGPHEFGPVCDPPADDRTPPRHDI